MQTQTQNPIQKAMESISQFMNIFVCMVQPSHFCPSGLKLVSQSRFDRNFGSYVIENVLMHSIPNLDFGFCPWHPANSFFNFILWVGLLIDWLKMCSDYNEVVTQVSMESEYDDTDAQIQMDAAAIEAFLQRTPVADWTQLEPSPLKRSGPVSYTHALDHGNNGNTIPNIARVLFSVPEKGNVDRVEERRTEMVSLFSPKATTAAVAPLLHVDQLVRVHTPPAPQFYALMRYGDEGWEFDSRGQAFPVCEVFDFKCPHCHNHAPCTMVFAVGGNALSLESYWDLADKVHDRK